MSIISRPVCTQTPGSSTMPFLESSLDPTFPRPIIPNRMIDPRDVAAPYNKILACRPDIEILHQAYVSLEESPLGYFGTMDEATRCLHFDAYCFTAQKLQYYYDELSEWERKISLEKEVNAQRAKLDPQKFSEWVRTHDQAEIEFQLARNRAVRKALEMRKIEEIQRWVGQLNQGSSARVAQENEPEQHEEVKAAARSASPASNSETGSALTKSEASTPSKSRDVEKRREFHDKVVNAAESLKSSQASSPVEKSSENSFTTSAPKSTTAESLLLASSISRQPRSTTAESLLPTSSISRQPRSITAESFLPTSSMLSQPRSTTAESSLPASSISPQPRLKRHALCLYPFTSTTTIAESSNSSYTANASPPIRPVSPPSISLLSLLRNQGINPPPIPASRQIFTRQASRAKASSATAPVFIQPRTREAKPAAALSTTARVFAPSPARTGSSARALSPRAAIFTPSIVLAFSRPIMEFKTEEAPPPTLPPKRPASPDSVMPLSLLGWVASHMPYAPLTHSESRMLRPALAHQISPNSAIQYLAIAMRAPVSMLLREPLPIEHTPGVQPTEREMEYLLYALRAWWTAMWPKAKTAEEGHAEKAERKIYEQDLRRNFVRVSQVEVKYMAKSLWTLVREREPTVRLNEKAHNTIRAWLGWQRGELGLFD